MKGGRVWFDVSFTRTQQGTIGITRTVRRLVASPGPDGRMPGTVAFHSSGYRSVPSVEPVDGRAPDAAAHGVAQRLFHWLHGHVMRRLVVLAVRFLPWPLLRGTWRAAARATFNALTRDEKPAAFQPGDQLVVADVSWNYPVWEAVRAARAQQVEIVLLVYDLMPIRRPEFCFALAPMVFTDCLREMLKCCDRVVCISRATEDDLRAWAREQRLRLPPTGYFYLGSDAVAKPEREEVRTEVSAFLAASPACFAAVGSFEPKKNYPMLLEVFERLWSRGDPARLLIAGRETSDCIEFTRRLRTHPEQGRRLITMHDASDAEVAAIYASCRALVFPSLFEGFGLPLVEARARGCRVIASDIPVFAELADEGVTLFRRDDPGALEQVLQGMAAAPPARSAPSLTWSESAAQFYRASLQLRAAA